MSQFPLKNSRFHTPLPWVKANHTPSWFFPIIADFAMQVSMKFIGQEQCIWIDERDPSSETAVWLQTTNAHLSQTAGASCTLNRGRPFARLFARSWRLLLQRLGPSWTPLYLRDLGGREHKGEVTFFWSAVLALEPEHTNEELLKWQNARRELCGGIVADVKRMFPLEQLLGGSNHCRVCSSQ